MHPSRPGSVRQLAHRFLLAGNLPTGRHAASQFRHVARARRLAAGTGGDRTARDRGNGASTWALAPGSSLPPRALAARRSAAMVHAAGAGRHRRRRDHAPGITPLSFEVTSAGQTIAQTFTLDVIPLNVLDTIPDAGRVRRAELQLHVLHQQRRLANMGGATRDDAAGRTVVESTHRRSVGLAGDSRHLQSPVEGHRRRPDREFSAESI